MKYWICSVLLLLGLGTFAHAARAEGIVDIAFPVEGTVSFKDSCVSGKAAREYYCYNNTVKSYIAICGKGTSCKAGACSR